MTKIDELIHPQESTSANENLVAIGLVGRPHGLRGGFFVKPLVGRHTVETTPLLLKAHEEKSTDFSIFLEGVPHTIDRVYVSQEKLVLRLEGCTRENVESFYNKILFVSRNFLMVSKDEVLVRDLLGCAVIAPDYGLVGHVLRVGSFGAQDNLEIQLAPNAAKGILGTEIVYYPYLDDFILKMDLPQKTITIEYIPEFLDPKNFSHQSEPKEE